MIIKLLFLNLNIKDTTFLSHEKSVILPNISQNILTFRTCIIYESLLGLMINYYSVCIFSDILMSSDYNVIIACCSYRVL
jgi:hypothetical protein